MKGSESVAYCDDSNSFKTGDLFKSGCEGLVNTVNVVGVMGKGIALEFRKRFPEMFPIYKSACQRRAVQTGKMWVWPPDPRERSPWSSTYPTKKSRVTPWFPSPPRLATWTDAIDLSEGGAQPRQPNPGFISYRTGIFREVQYERCSAGVA
jgi:hypothetical protein